MARKLTRDDIIDRFRLVHGDKYDYSKFEYINAITKGVIICPKHGEFLQSSNVHEKGVNCPKCAKEKSERCGFKMTKEQFLEKANSIHNNKFEYDLTNFNGTSSKINIKCLKHGWFEQSVRNHLMGQGCKECGNEIKREKMVILFDDFIKRANIKHNNKYDYSKVNYINNKSLITIICPIHGEFQQRVDEHLKGKGCAKCVGRNRSLEDFINEAKKVHGDKYDYSLSNYITAETKIKIKCNKCGYVFEQKPWSHLQNHGCPKCKLSKGENEIEELLKYNNIDFEQQKKFDWLGRQSLDFYIPKLNIAIEVQGLQHFKMSKHFGGIKSFNKTIQRDKNKYQLCKDHGIKILYYTNVDINISEYIDTIYNDKSLLLEEIQKNI